MQEMYEWEVRYSETRKEGSRISCASFSATVYAKNEDEVRAIMAEEEPDAKVDKIMRGMLIEDDEA